MVILGINYFFHDSSACVVVDGRLVVAMEEERFTRRKHTSTFPSAAIAACLRFAGIDYADVDHIAVSVKPGKDWLAKALYGAANVTRLKPFLKHEVLGTRGRQANLRDWYAAQYGGSKKQPPIHFVPHHTAHAAGSFLVSPYDEAAILSMDGSGEWATSMLGAGRGLDVECFHESFFPMSLGSFYEAATEFCGFKPNYDEGKTMGLAPFGDPAVFGPKAAEIARVDDAGGIRIDLSYFDYQFWGYRRCGPRFHATFGRPRGRTEPFADNHNNVAAAFQRVLEEAALKMCSVLRQHTQSRHLVIAGGVALNSVMNGRLLRESGFDDIYVMPAAGDNGTCIGAAYYLYHTKLRKPRASVHDDPYLGTQYDDAAIEKLLRECKLPFLRAANVVDEAARLLADGQILGWLQGRMEIGPRALGNRSILANPTLPHMKDKINAEVKHREAYRPFAPSTPVEHKDRYFDIRGDSPFMLKVCDVLPSARDLLPAITHVDGTARLQTVHRETNDLYHRLLNRFGEITGTPVLLNTSFNIQGEPIVESPLHAVRCFFSTGLDYLVMGNYVIGKQSARLPAAG
jgi:carbamoyltransferase